jgi:AcrR family transcriptional regulator
MERRSDLCQDGSMIDSHPRAERRVVALSREQIIRAAVAILDDGGIDALTFRALAARLSTGAGAIYHHVANKGDLVAAAAVDAVSSALTQADDDAAHGDIRAVMLSAFDAISTRRWLGTQLASAPWQPAVLLLFERVGSELDAMGIPEASQFDAASVLVHHLLGIASQVDAGNRLSGRHTGRQSFLESATAAAISLGPPVAYPFLTRISSQLAHHDDRDQFQAGVDIIVSGVMAR